PEAPDTWIASVRDPQLSESVPVEIRKLYEVARSSIIYGYLCYPLLTLGIEQLHRVVELVARLRARDLGCATKRKSFDGQAQLPAFKEAIDWLVDKSVIPQSDRDRWDAMRHLRNIASHPTTQTILMPGNAISFLRWALEAVELLYSQSLP
ncbi:MAG: DUF4145 domain-containing protein, partial [Alphaproteobacteria bacterium]|nr:DUF4145 domain-containing protein [Alphaproteobacteria bacterium]